ncbi:hypothetical protein [Halalkalicoccus salilacus]|uniref:hypothetical protein n=1 Tax=Halalkalicoccus salilacus TaxID=3117459 RepID=UPI00300EB731
MEGTDLSRRLFIGSAVVAATGLAGCTDFGGQGDGQSEEDDGGEDGGEQGSQGEEEEEGEDEEDD